MVRIQVPQPAYIKSFLDDIAFAVRRSGRRGRRSRDESRYRGRLGAYRLIQLFGTTRPLTFEADCAGRGLLLRNGIPEPHIAPIAETFLAEEKEARSNVFDRDVCQQMADVGLADTLANRERAKMELYRAKADALLNVAERWRMIDRRQNALVATTLADEERAALVFRTADEVGADTKPSVPLPDAAEQAPNPLPSEAESVVDRTALFAEPVVEIHAAPQTSSPEIISGKPIRPTLPRLQVGFLRLDEFEASYEQLYKNNRENWADTASDVRTLVRMFRDILEEHGVAHSGEIGQEHIAALRQHLNDIPTRYGQSARQRVMKPAALRAFAAAEVARAERLGNKPLSVGLSVATIRKHLGSLDAFLTHVRASGYEVADWSLKSLRPRKPKAGALRLQQVKPTPNQVRPIFDLPVFTGCQDVATSSKSGLSIDVYQSRPGHESRRSTNVHFRCVPFSTERAGGG